MKEDFLLIRNIDITGYKEIIDNITNSIAPLNPNELSTKSTRGYNSKQYTLTPYTDQFLNIQKAVKDKINEDLEGELELMISWTVLGQEGSYHKVHDHGHLNDLSTVLYLEAPKEPNLYQSGEFYCFLRDDACKITQIKHVPFPGDLIIFPPHLQHGAYPQSKGLRQTLNMDFKVL